jgi:copper chaperone CopZ
MKETFLSVQKEFCGECSLALKHFMENMKGIESVTASEGRIIITYDDSEVSEREILKVARDSIGEMGYTIIDS